MLAGTALLASGVAFMTPALFAATYPERVLSLVLISPLLLGKSDSEIPGWGDAEGDEEPADGRDDRPSGK